MSSRKSYNLPNKKLVYFTVSDEKGISKTLSSFYSESRTSRIF